MTIYYVRTDGADSHNGLTNTAAGAKATWQAAINLAVAGDTVSIGPGTYALATATRSYGVRATTNGPITIQGSGSVLDCGNIVDTYGPWGLDLRGDWWTVNDIEVINCKQANATALPGGVRLMDASNCALNRVKSHHHMGVGFTAGAGFANNVFTDCDAHDNYDSLTVPAGGNADGFQFANLLATDTGNKCIRCRSWSNSDDGWDFWNTEASVELDGCWAFWNGYIPGTLTKAGDGNGFKLGKSSGPGAGHYLNQCLAFENFYLGYADNTSKRVLTVYNCTGWGNNPSQPTYPDFNFADGGLVAHTVKNCLSGKGFIWGQASLLDTHNSWNTPPGVTISAADFQSVSSVGADGARGADGSLPVLQFLRLAPGSDCIDAGAVSLGAYP